MKNARFPFIRLSELRHAGSAGDIKGDGQRRNPNKITVNGK